MDQGRARRAGGAHCTGAALGAAGGRADLSAGHFLVQCHCKSVDDIKLNFKKTSNFQLMTFKLESASQKQINHDSSGPDHNIVPLLFLIAASITLKGNSVIRLPGSYYPAGKLAKLKGYRLRCYAVCYNSCRDFQGTTFRLYFFFCDSNTVSKE